MITGKKKKKGKKTKEAKDQCVIFLTSSSSPKIYAASSFSAKQLRDKLVVPV